MPWRHGTCVTNMPWHVATLLQQCCNIPHFMLRPLVFAKITSTNRLFLTFVAFIWNLSVLYKHSTWPGVVCVFQTDFCTIFTSFAVRAAQPRVPLSVYCTMVPREITFISSFLSTLCTTSTVKVSPMSCFSTNNLITLYNHFITISAASETAMAPKLLPRPD